MITKATIKSVRENTRSYDGKNGKTYVHVITLTAPLTIENDSVNEGEYHSLKSNCDAFVAGREHEIEASKRVNGQYTSYIFKPVKTNKPEFAGAKREVKDQGTITALSSVSSAAAYYAQRTATVDDLMALAERINTWANSKSTLK